MSVDSFIHSLIPGTELLSHSHPLTTHHCLQQPTQHAAFIVEERDHFGEKYKHLYIQFVVSSFHKKTCLISSLAILKR